MVNKIWLLPAKFCIRSYLWRPEPLQRIWREVRPWKIFYWSCYPYLLEQWDLFSLLGNPCPTAQKTHSPLPQTHRKNFALLRRLMSLMKKKKKREIRTMGKVDVTRNRDSSLISRMYLWQGRSISVDCVTPWELSIYDCLLENICSSIKFLNRVSCLMRSRFILPTGRKNQVPGLS